MTAAELKALDDKRREREEELLLLLLLLLGWGVTRELAGGETGAGTQPVQPGAVPGTPRTQPPGTRGPTSPPGGNRGASSMLARLRDILTRFGVPEIAGSMADAHLDAFTLIEPAADLAPDRDTLIREYGPAATEMVTAMLDTLQQAGGATLAEALLAAKYSRSDSTGLELGAERQIVTASNAGLIGGAVLRQSGPKLTGFRHVSVIDDRTTAICTERNGLMLAARDLYWELNFPSLHWRCRSSVVPIFGPFRASNWRPKHPPDVGFGRMPVAIRRMIRRIAA